MLPQGNRHRRVPLLIIILGMLLLTFASMGYQPVSFPANPGTRKIVILVGGDHNYPPYSYLVGNEIQGFDNDLIRAVGEAIGAEVVISLSPWALPASGWKAGRWMSLLGWLFRWNGRHITILAFPQQRYLSDIFRLNGSPIRSLDDLRDKRIIVQEGGLCMITCWNATWQGNHSRVGSAGCFHPAFDGKCRCCHFKQNAGIVLHPKVPHDPRNLPA